MEIDIRTLVVVLGITHLIQVAVFLQQYLINRSYPGFGWWLLWSISEVAGFTFLLLRQIPALLKTAILFQNSLIILGTIFIYIGVLRFLGRRVNHWAVIALFTAFVAALAFFTWLHDSMMIRTVMISATMATTALPTAHALYRYKLPAIAATADFNAAVYLIHALVFAYRTVMVLSGTQINNVFASTLFNYLPYLDGLVVSLFWSFGFILIVNQRLHADMKEAKEHFEQIFDTGPDSVIITRLHDGLIVNVNDRFVELCGYSRAEALGSSTVAMNLWEKPEERQGIIEELQASGLCRNREATFRRKDGTLVAGVISAKVIRLNDQPHVISVTRDITELKKTRDSMNQLSGMLPICACCKQIRNDQGYWERIEAYISSHSKAIFSHSLCPACLEKHYPDEAAAIRQTHGLAPDCVPKANGA